MNYKGIFFAVFCLWKMWLVRGRETLKAGLPEWPKSTIHDLFTIHMYIYYSFGQQCKLKNVNKIRSDIFLVNSLVDWAWESNISGKSLYTLWVPMILVSTVHVEWSKDNAIIVPSIPGPKARKGNRNRNIKKTESNAKGMSTETSDVVGIWSWLLDRTGSRETWTRTFPGICLPGLVVHSTNRPWWWWYDDDVERWPHHTWWFMHKPYGLHGLSK